MSISKRGALIVLEGCDKSGKSTQSSLLVEYLRSLQIKVKHIAFPNRQSSSPSGCLINSYLTNKHHHHHMNDESIHLLFAVNRWEIQHEMKKQLNLGTTLIVDRYSYSGIAYSVAKGLSFDWCQAPEIGLIQPDRVFFLNINDDVDILASRSNFGEERYERKEFQKKVSQVFITLCESEKCYWTEINAKQDVASIHEIISRETIKVINEVEKVPPMMKLLWQQ